MEFKGTYATREHTIHGDSARGPGLTSSRTTFTPNGLNPVEKSDLGWVLCHPLFKHPYFTEGMTALDGSYAVTLQTERFAQSLQIPE